MKIPKRLTVYFHLQNLIKLLTLSEHEEIIVSMCLAYLKHFRMIQGKASEQELIRVFEHLGMNIKETE